MTTVETVEIFRGDLSRTRIVSAPAPALADGEALVRIEKYALTANNVTYAVVGDQFGYWRFFPAGEGWGRTPVWGVAVVEASRAEGVAAGERLYGYFPMASHLVMRPDRVRADRFVDGAPARAGLPAVYNAYVRLDAEPGYDRGLDELRMLLFPLYATSFCLADYFKDRGWFGAEEIVIVSASSKTAIGIGYALAEEPSRPRTLGLTSARQKARVEALGVYDRVAAYDDLSPLDPSRPTAIIDMAGDGGTLAALHSRLGDNMRHTSNVGATHYDARRPGEGVIRERSELFFAPAHIEKRAMDWGPGEFEKRAYAFWRRAAAKSAPWIRLERFAGAEEARRAWTSVRDGAFGPESGVVVTV